MNLQTVRWSWLLIAVGLISTITVSATSCTMLAKQSFKQQGGQSTPQSSLDSSPSYNPKAETLIQSGDKFVKERRLVEARDAYQRAIQIDPKNAVGFAKLGWIFFLQGKWNEGIIAYQKAIELNPKDIESHNMLSSMLRIAGKRAEAIFVLRKAIQTDPNSAESYQLLGLLLAYEDNLTEASKACNRAIQIKPDYEQGHDCVGIIFTSQGNLDKAISAYQTSIKLFHDAPSNAELEKLPQAVRYYHLSLAFAAQGKRSEAVDNYNIALQLFKPLLSQLINSSSLI